MTLIEPLASITVTVTAAVAAADVSPVVSGGGLFVLVGGALVVILRRFPHGHARAGEGSSGDHPFLYVAVVVLVAALMPRENLRVRGGLLLELRGGRDIGWRKGNINVSDGVGTGTDGRGGPRGGSGARMRENFYEGFGEATRGLRRGRRARGPARGDPRARG